jgi:hypothetical protein
MLTKVSGRANKALTMFLRGKFSSLLFDRRASARNKDLKKLDWIEWFMTIMDSERAVLAVILGKNLTH